jgi:outer membrane biosynthesis protein TonB
MIDVIALAAALATSEPAVATPKTAQERFDAATLAVDQGRCKEAIEQFDSLAALKKVAANPGVLSTIKVRKGECLLKLGLSADAEQVLSDALRTFPDTIDYHADRLNAQMILGRIAELALAYELARPRYEVALQQAQTPIEKIHAMMAIARVTMFDDPDAALRNSQQAVALVSTVSDISKQTAAQIRTVHGRVLLNRGDAKSALAELKSAVSQQGGLGTTVSLSEVMTRSDVAIAAMRTGNEEVAREYAAYTGAGRFKKAPFASGRDMNPPSCGGAADIQPNDVAVVEFSIADNGAVTGAQPIWASRPGPMAREFARAVRDWSWSAEDAKSIPMFFRLVTRIEMRCSNRALRPAPIDALRPAVLEWAKANNLTAVETAGGSAALLPQLRDQLAARTAPDTIDAAPLLIALLSNPAASKTEKAGWGSRLAIILRNAKAPPAVLASFGKLIAFGSVENAKEAATSLRTLMAEPIIAANSEARAALILTLFDLDPHARAMVELMTQVRSVANDATLAERHPLKVGALVRLADVQAGMGDLDGARASYAATGLDAQQCAVISPQAQIKRTGASSSDFPMEAMRWGFEGWVRFEADVAADGKTLNPRAIIAYPPFIFPDAALGIARGVRYTQSYRPAGGLGCTGVQQSINFRIP